MIALVVIGVITVMAMLIDPRNNCPYPLFYENQDYYLSIRSNAHEAVTFHHDSPLIRNAVHQEYDDHLSGHLNFRTEVGLTELVVRHPSLFAPNILAKLDAVRTPYLHRGLCCTT